MPAEEQRARTRSEVSVSVLRPGFGCGRRRGVEDGLALLGALGLALGHEPFQRDPHDLGRDLALGVGLAEPCGDFRSRARFLLVEEVAANELDQRGRCRLRGARGLGRGLGGRCLSPCGGSLARPLLPAGRRAGAAPGVGTAAVLCDCAAASAGSGVMPSACCMFTSTVWSCCRAANCSCREAISAPMRSCSLTLRSRSPVTCEMYCDVSSVAVVFSGMVLAFLCV